MENEQQLLAGGADDEGAGCKVTGREVVAAEAVLVLEKLEHAPVVAPLPVRGRFVALQPSFGFDAPVHLQDWSTMIGTCAASSDRAPVRCSGCPTCFCARLPPRLLLAIGIF